MSFEATDYESRRVFAIILPAPQTFRHNFRIQQECIPVGCVPPAAVAVGGGGVPPSWGISLRGVGVPPSQRGVSLPGGCLLPGGVLPAGECLLPGGLPARVGGVLPSRGGLPARGVSLPGGVSLMGDPPCEQNDKQV